MPESDSPDEGPKTGWQRRQEREAMPGSKAMGRVPSPVTVLLRVNFRVLDSLSKRIPRISQSATLAGVEFAILSCRALFS